MSLAGDVNRFVSRSLVPLRDVLLVALGAFLGALAVYLPLGVLVALSLSVTVVLVVIATITRVDDPGHISGGECESAGTLGGASDRSASGLDPSCGDVYVAGFLVQPYDPVTGEQELFRIVSTGSMSQGIPLQIKSVTIICPGFTFDPANFSRMTIIWSMDSTDGVLPGRGGAVPGD